MTATRQEVYVIDYDQYDQDYNLIAQGTHGIYDLDNAQHVNRLILTFNQRALDNGLRTNFYRTLRSYTDESIANYLQTPHYERANELFKRLSNRK